MHDQGAGSRRLQPTVIVALYVGFGEREGAVQVCIVECEVVGFEKRLYGRLKMAGDVLWPAMRGGCQSSCSLIGMTGDASYVLGQDA